MKKLFTKAWTFISGLKIWAIVGTIGLLVLAYLKERGDYYQNKAKQAEVEADMKISEKEVETFQEVEKVKEDRLEEKIKEVEDEKIVTNNDGFTEFDA